MNKKETKRTLLVSVMALLLCSTMLSGSTFAWFTDTAATSVNRIEAGRLQIDIIDAEGASIDGGTLNWKKAAGHENETILWEPNCTYELGSFQVINNGNLALKYKISISGATGDTELLDVLEWTYQIGESPYDMNAEHSLAAQGKDGDKSGLITISAHMLPTAGNHYQGMAIDNISITVYATQDTVEYDSTGNTYDENAVYPQRYTASNAADYNEALNSVTTAENKNVEIKLSGDETTITGANGINPKAGNNLSIDMNHKTIEVGGSVGSHNTATNGAQLLKGSTVLLKNGTYKFAEDNQNSKILIQNYSNLTLENMTLDASNVMYALSTNCGNVTIKGNTNISVAAGGTALDIMHWENTSYNTEGSHVVFDESMTGTVDGKIEVYCWRNENTIIRPVDDGGATLIIKGGTFKNCGLTLEQFKEFVPAGYTVTTNSDGSFTVSH